MSHGTGAHSALSGAPYASFAFRAGAFLIDWLLLLIPASIISGAILLTQFPSQSPAPWQVNRIAGPVFALLAWLYYSLMESSRFQATFGKRLFRLAVTGLDGNGISFARASGRYFAKYVSALPLGVGFLLPLFNKKRQALHNMLAKCLVVKRP